MTKPLGLFGRFALRLLGPRPAMGRLATLATFHPLTVAPIEMSGRKLGYWIAVHLFCGLPLAALTCFTLAMGHIGIALALCGVLLLLSFNMVQLAQVANCRKPVLVLEKEGLRVNFTGDLIRYDQITEVSYSRYGAAMLLKIVPGVRLITGRTRYGLASLGAPLAILSLYTDPIMEIGDEIERRMKIAKPAIETADEDPMPPGVRKSGFVACALASAVFLFAFVWLSHDGGPVSRDMAQMRGMLVVAAISLWIFGAMIFLFPRQK